MHHLIYSDLALQLGISMGSSPSKDVTYSEDELHHLFYLKALSLFKPLEIAVLKLKFAVTFDSVNVDYNLHSLLTIIGTFPFDNNSDLSFPSLIISLSLLSNKLDFDVDLIRILFLALVRCGESNTIMESTTLEKVDGVSGLDGGDGESSAVIGGDGGGVQSKGLNRLNDEEIGKNSRISDNMIDSLHNSSLQDSSLAGSDDKGVLSGDKSEIFYAGSEKLVEDKSRIRSSSGKNPQTSISKADAERSNFGQRPVNDSKKSDKLYRVDFLQPILQNDTLTQKALKIDWNNFQPIKNYGLQYKDELLPTSKFLEFLTFLIVMDSQIDSNFKKFNQIKLYAKFLLKYFDLKPGNMTNYEIFSKLNIFKKMIINLFANFINTKLFDIKLPSMDKLDFEYSTVVSENSLPYICSIVNNFSDQFISKKNLVKLYSASDSGFSIRTIEQKIFKWKSPTIFFVGGKRINSDTMTNDKLYIEFDSQYPRFFKNSKLKEWQGNDTIVYAILVTEPWKNSNKVNFGDENTIIFQIRPFFDIYKSNSSTVLQNKLVYFNTLGCGIGFGNDQPINKNGVKKFSPGSVSLTIEENLRFAFFRHLSTPMANTNKYFQNSKQEALGGEDFENRFLIMNLEVWGIGSTLELDDQRRQWEWENKQAENRQNVNLKNLGEERAFLEMAGLVGQAGSGGSV